MRNACSWQAPMVTLADGRQVPSDSLEWRDECEARHILSLPNITVRHEWLDIIEKKRGPEARKALEARIMDLWRLRRGSAA